MFLKALSHYVNPSHTLKILHLRYTDAPSAMTIGLNLFPNLKRFMHARAFLLFICCKRWRAVFASVFTWVTVFEIRRPSLPRVNEANVKSEREQTLFSCGRFLQKHTRCLIPICPSFELSQLWPAVLTLSPLYLSCPSCHSSDLLPSCLTFNTWRWWIETG